MDGITTKTINNVGCVNGVLRCDVATGDGYSHCVLYSVWLKLYLSETAAEVSDFSVSLIAYRADGDLTNRTQMYLSSFTPGVTKSASRSGDAVVFNFSCQAAPVNDGKGGLADVAFVCNVPIASLSPMSGGYYYTLNAGNLCNEMTGEPTAAASIFTPTSWSVYYPEAN
ncbi:MAG: hypothetical protein HUK22_06895 [Thermoguttaceae bacterium]|nr:hypothetical protein [Thermoguttaceae bacterium]